MNKIIMALMCLISISAFSQENMVDVIMDGKPAKMNTTTGVFTFTKGTYTFTVSFTEIVSKVIKSVLSILELSFR